MASIWRAYRGRSPIFKHWNHPWPIEMLLQWEACTNWEEAHINWVYFTKVNLWMQFTFILSHADLKCSNDWTLLGCSKDCLLASFFSHTFPSSLLFPPLLPSLHFFPPFLLPSSCPLFLPPFIFLSVILYLFLFLNL